MPLPLACGVTLSAHFLSPCSYVAPDPPVWLLEQTALREAQPPPTLPKEEVVSLPRVPLCVHTQHRVTSPMIFCYFPQTGQQQNPGPRALQAVSLNSC